MTGGEEAPWEARWDVKRDDENGFFLICCSVAFLQQILPQENSSGRSLSIFAPTCNKKVVQSLNYLLKVFTILLPPSVAFLPVLIPHCLRQQPGASPGATEGCDLWGEGNMGAGRCIPLQSHWWGAGWPLCPSTAPQDSLRCRRSCRNTDSSCSLTLAPHTSLQLISATGPGR